MEYSEWTEWEKQFPWLWCIVSNGRVEKRTIACKRAEREIPLFRPQPFPDSRLWIASGALTGPFSRPRVFEVDEIRWEAELTIRQQIRKLDYRSGLYGLYFVVGTIRPYPTGEDLIIYKPPQGVKDFRSLY